MATKTMEVLKVTAVSTDGVRSVRKAPKGWTLETKVWAVEGKSHNTKTGHQSRIGPYFDNKVAAHSHADALNEGNAGRLQFHKGNEDRVVYAAKVVDAKMIAVEVEVEVPDTVASTAATVHGRLPIIKLVAHLKASAKAAVRALL